MTETEKEPQPTPQATHTTQTTEQITFGPMVPDVLAFKWSGKSIAIALFLAGMVGSFFTFTASEFGGFTRRDQQVEDRLKILEAEKITLVQHQALLDEVQRNSVRISRLEDKYDYIIQQHEKMLVEDQEIQNALKVIREMLVKQAGRRGGE